MKKCIVLLIFIAPLVLRPAAAQTGLKFGFKAGYSIGTQYGITPAELLYEVDSDASHGFTGGILLHFPITEAFSVQQEFLYTQKGSEQFISMSEPSVSTRTTYTLNYFEMPIVFRYHFVNIGNIGIYGSSGFGLSLLLNGDYKVDGVIDFGAGPTPFGESGDTDGLDEFDYSFIYGLGATCALFQQTWFFEFRQTIGWNTLMMPTAEGEEPAPLRNQTYAFSLGVYF